MRKGDMLRCSHRDGMTQLFGRYVKEEGGDSASPPTTISVEITGVSPEAIKLYYHSWAFEVMLPWTPGSVVMDGDNRLYTLIGHTKWTDAQTGSQVDSEDLRKKFTVVFDAAVLP